MSVPLNELTDFLLDQGPVIIGSIHEREPGISDLFCESSHTNHIVCTARGKHGFRPAWSQKNLVDQGIALRTWQHGKECIAAASGLSERAFNDCKDRLGHQKAVRHNSPAILIHEPDTALPDAPERTLHTEKRMLIQEALDAAFSYNEAVQQVQVEYRDSTWHRFIMNEQCCLVRKFNHLIEFRIEVLLANGRTGASQVATSNGMAHFFSYPLKNVSRQAVDQAEGKKYSHHFSPGLYPIAFPSGWGGLLLHEAIGHSLEADVATENLSPASLQIGKKIGPHFLCISDNPTMPEGRASYDFDDEGSEASETVLVENGILMGLLTDRARAHQLNLPVSGNGRRMNYQTAPLPRMSNLITWSQNEQAQFDLTDYDIVLEVTNLANGYVDKSGTQFVLFAREALLLKHGVPQFPIENLIISAPIEGFLYNIQAMKGTPILDNSRGFCVKQGQTLPVSVGSPRMIIHQMMVEQSP